MQKPNLKLDWASPAAAKYAVEHWHYSGTVPRGKLVKVGVWEDDDFIGVVIFSMGASPWLHNRFGIGKLEVCELTRIALREHQTRVSRIIRIALKLLHDHCPGIRLVVSFADPHFGHVGSIYQAAGWTYCGTSDAATYYIDRKGKVWHARNISAVGECRAPDRWKTRKHSAEGMRREKRPGKHRYCWSLDRSLKERLGEIAQPYPKLRQK